VSSAGTTRVERQLERIGRFARHLQDASSTDRIRFVWGTAVFNRDFPRSWAHNFLRVESLPEDVTAEDLAGAAERLHGAAGHSHRQVVVEDASAGERLQKGFKRLGWAVERLVYMAHTREPDRWGDTSIVRELTFEEVRPALERFWRQAPHGDSEETVRQLVERSALTARAATVRHFAVLVDGEAVSTCDLYSDGRTAQIEDVATFEDFRNRGYARATVSRALQEARAGGHDVVFLEADADDWPRRLYDKLGFDALAQSYQFTRPGLGQG
jgi:GNAT superfamily N-acetyltransferase